LSSISTLELAWEGYPLGATGRNPDGQVFTLNQEYFCSRVAETNDLKLLRWVREEKECAWDWQTSGAASGKGNLDMLKYCCENGCEVDARHCATTAKFGHLDCLEYLRSKNCPWNERVCELAHEYNHMDILTYAVGKVQVMNDTNTLYLNNRTSSRFKNKTSCSVLQPLISNLILKVST
jgi:hypothetical protein